MLVLSSRRKITLPKKLCDRLHLNPGDPIDIVERDGRITIIKQLKDVGPSRSDPNKTNSDAES